MNKIILRKVEEHNLKGFDVEIPHNALTVVTGVSGSGKSSLAFDTIYRESQRRFLATFSAKARLQLGKVKRPAVDSIEGLYPAIALSQNAPHPSPRSTVGTLSEVYDYLRLLYARLGKSSLAHTSASLFSFNSPVGACPSCSGLGIIDEVAPELLVADEKLTIRQGALVPTTNSGYIVYSQVTMDVLDQVCQAHGFNVDTPWNELTKEQIEVVFWGSEAIKVPFGKHPLESRLKWKGITARPREEGYYKGIATIISDILARNRTDNILRFAKSVTCHDCKGSRLCADARKVLIDDFSIDNRAALSLLELKEWLLALPDDRVTKTIVGPMDERLGLLLDLGLSHLTLSRRTNTLSAGELNRIRLATQTASSLNGVLFVLDEPSVGLHRQDMKRLLRVIRQLVDKGNTVIVVEHDEAIIKAADWIIDIGEGAGSSGGKLLFSGPYEKFLSSAGPTTSPTKKFLTNNSAPSLSEGKKGSVQFFVRGASGRNLKNIDVPFQTRAFNVVTGVSGSGKSTLIEDTLGQALRQLLHGAKERSLPFSELVNGDEFDKVIIVTQDPIGRTPRSNAATYTKLFDIIRTLFAATERAKELGLTKSHFSFNARGGRCPHCEGSGVTRIPMHFLEDGVNPCPHCRGKRFNAKTLSVKLNGKNISEVLDMSVREASVHFAQEKRVMAYLTALNSLGLHYLTLGQPATTISGGEAQRVKLATELARKSSEHTLYLLDEPTTGLHHEDVTTLLTALQKLVRAGNTVIVVEHNLEFLSQADWLVDLGPGSGPFGGQLLFAGFPLALLKEQSPTALALAEHLKQIPLLPAQKVEKSQREAIELKGVRTNNLKSIDVKMPLNKMTVVSGPSGSGKSSLAFDTLFAEGRRKFTESLSTYARRFMKSVPKASLDDSCGLTPTVAISQSSMTNSPRSTVATMTGIADNLRLLYSRFGTGLPEATMSHLSFNHHLGACPKCHGLGSLTYCSPEKLVTHPSLPLVDGALDGTKTGKFYGERQGQYVATLQEVGRQLDFDFALPYIQLDKEAQDLAMFGTGEREYSVSWCYKRGKREGTHQLKTKWQGFARLVEDEYERKQQSVRSLAIERVLAKKKCPLCSGSRLSKESGAVSWCGVALAQLYHWDLTQSESFFSKSLVQCEQGERVIIEDLLRSLRLLKKIGLSYLTLDRATPTLSGGEVRRLRLVNQLAGKLCGVALVVDEPTIGLHHKDVYALLEVLDEIKNLGNTLVIVEHNRSFWKEADYIIELGPGGGEAGGTVTAQGTLDEILDTASSSTGSYLRNEILVEDGRERYLDSYMEIKGCCANNLKDINVKIPQKALVVVTGVSGSGKTSLLFDVLAPSLLSNRPVACQELCGIEQSMKVRIVDQSPPSAALNSTPATFLSIFEEIRSLFARTALAKDKKLTKSRFSYMNKSSQCSNCKGMGRVKVSLDFLADFYVTCDQCNGMRYANDILAVEYEGHSIGQVLELTVKEACSLFQENKKILKKLQQLEQVGLGYLTLGQPLSTLSGGENQRLKLLAGLTNGDKCCYLLDEPTTGLHPLDVKALLSLLHELVDEGNTVLVIEHDLDIIKSADWVIDLGPDGGPGGGKLVFASTAKELMEKGVGHTAEALRQL